ncbi:MAG: hypothetical protein L0Z53_06400 [Acidobacteriales bacterium]|nr:hypothetical protein [Terriglobales bacterium]
MMSSGTGLGGEQQNDGVPKSTGAELAVNVAITITAGITNIRIRLFIVALS